MKDMMDFVQYLVVLGMILSMLCVLGVVGAIWANKGKIFLTVIACIGGYLFLKKKKDNNILKNVNDSNQLLK